MKIVIAAVMYSPNLGDGLIAECLSAGLHALADDLDICWLDLAGRDGFDAPQTDVRTRVLDILSALPEVVSEPLAGLMIGHQVRTKLVPGLEGSLSGADLVVIGGGQLLQGANLNFPLKLARLVRAIESLNIPS